LTLYGNDFALMKQSFDKGDITRAITYARTHALQGDVNAMYDLGLLYYAKGDISKAKTWLERSVKNDGKGYLGLAILLFESAHDRNAYVKVQNMLINAPQSKLTKALMAVSKDLASARNDASAEDYLLVAELFLDDVIIHKNMQIGLYLTNTAAKKGSARAMEIMGDAYWRSNYTVDTLIVAPQTGNALNIALEYYRSAAALGNLDATAKMGKLFIIGPRNLRRIQYGVEQILKAAQGGSALGAKMAGELYMHGQGVRADRQEAMKWYLKATQICDVNLTLSRLYADEAEKYAQAYKKCSQEYAQKQKYHILFEQF